MFLNTRITPCPSTVNTQQKGSEFLNYYHQHQPVPPPRPLPFIIKALLLIVACTAGAPLIYLALFAIGHLLNFLGGY